MSVHNNELVAGHNVTCRKIWPGSEYWWIQGPSQDGCNCLAPIYLFVTRYQPRHRVLDKHHTSKWHTLWDGDHQIEHLWLEGRMWRVHGTGYHICFDFFVSWNTGIMCTTVRWQWDPTKLSRTPNLSHQDKKNSLTFVPKSLIDNNPAWVSIMFWIRIVDKSLCEPMLTRFADAYMNHLADMS